MLPEGFNLYTLAVTDNPVGTPRELVVYDEVNAVAPNGATVEQVMAYADLSDYPGCRVVGLIDQSEGTVRAEYPEGALAWT